MQQETLPDWQSIGDWKDGRVRSGARSVIWISLVFGIAFTGLSIPGVLAIPEEMAKGNHAILLVLLFTVTGIAALCLFVYYFMAWRKFGSTEVILDPVPGSIGGDFAGCLKSTIPFHSGNIINITLSCQHSRTSGTGKNRSTHISAVWQREGIATTRQTSDGTEISFKFQIPDDLPASEPFSDNYHLWSLQLECELPGIDFSRTFVVPVVNTETPLFSTLDIPYVKDSAPLDKAPEGIVKITQTANSIQFYYPWHRHLGMALSLVVFGVVFFGIGYFIGQKSGSLIFPITFCGVGSLVAVAGLYMLSNTLSTSVSPDGIQAVRNILGFRFKREVARKDILKLDRSIGSQKQGAGAINVYYRITAHTRDDRKIVIADTLCGSRLADFIENKIRQALAMEDSKNEGLKLVL